MYEAVSRLRSHLSRSPLQDEEPTTYLVNTGHRLPTLYDPLSHHEEKLAKMEEKTFKKLLRLLPGSFDPDAGPLSKSYDWIREQEAAVDNLDPTFLKEEWEEEDDDGGIPLFDDLPLCIAHKRLKPGLVAALVIPIMEECTTRSNVFRDLLDGDFEPNENDDEDTGSLKRLVSLLNLLKTNFTKLTFDEVMNLADNVTKTKKENYFVKNRCAACIVAMVGGRLPMIWSLLSSVLARHELHQRRGTTYEMFKAKLLRKKKSVALEEREAEVLARMMSGKSTIFCRGRNGALTADEIAVDKKWPAPALNRAIDYWCSLWRRQVKENDERIWYMDWSKPVGKMPSILIKRTLERQDREKGRVKGEAEAARRTEGRGGPLENGVVEGLENAEGLKSGRSTRAISGEDLHSVGGHDRSTTPTADLIPPPLRVGSQKRKREEYTARADGPSNYASRSPSPLADENGNPPHYGDARDEMPSSLHPGPHRSLKGDTLAGLAQDDITFKTILRDSHKTARRLSPESSDPQSTKPAEQRGQGEVGEDRLVSVLQQPDQTKKTPAGKNPNRRVRWYSDEPTSPETRPRETRMKPVLKRAPETKTRPGPVRILRITNGAPSPISPPRKPVLGSWALIPITEPGDSSVQKLSMRWVGEGDRDETTMTLNDVFRAAWEYQGKRQLV